MWPNIWSILENIVCLRKSAFCNFGIECFKFVCGSTWMWHCSSPLLIISINDLSIVESRELKFPRIIVLVFLLSVLIMVILYFLDIPPFGYIHSYSNYNLLMSWSFFFIIIMTSFIFMAFFLLNVYLVWLKYNHSDSLWGYHWHTSFSDSSFLSMCVLKPKSLEGAYH